ncbi:hypothetical protein Avbf_05890, partial [Armadillidium vulgare]
MKMKRWNLPFKICSDHFTPDCINPGVGFGEPTLKQNAIPTIFNFSPSSKLKKRKKNTLKPKYILKYVVVNDSSYFFLKKQ